VRDLDPKAPSLEGYLFPDTYHFTRTQSMHDMAAAMVRRFRQNIKEMGINQNVHDLVTMASIVEKETGAPEERPEVASVFYNRLQKNMELKTDPSAIYAALLNNRYSGVIHQSDLHFDSPYNTYRNPGLPPGPISNPGKASLQAAMHPAQTDFLYFVADPQNQGHHRFARTDAHEASRNPLHVTGEILRGHVHETERNHVRRADDCRSRLACPRGDPRRIHQRRRSQIDRDSCLGPEPGRHVLRHSLQLGEHQLARCVRQAAHTDRKRTQDTEDR